MMVQALSIRTKLIMAMLALVASVALMGMTAEDANAAGVTEIRWVENHTPYPVYVWDHQFGARKVISPNSAVSVNLRVPWATNDVEFNWGRYIEIGWQGTTPSSGPCQMLGSASTCAALAIWQEGHNRQSYPGDYIRYTRDMRYNKSAPPMAGTSNTGGRRNLIIRHTTVYPTGPACCGGSVLMQAGLI